MKKNKAKKAVFAIFIWCFFILEVFFLISFLIPRKIIIQSSAFNTQTEATKNENLREMGYLKSFEDIKRNFLLQKKNFLEIHLEEMKIRLWKKGNLEKEFPILAKGDPQGWGGSAVGLYKILSGSKKSFSLISNVYMPYSLHYYGKYYIHGEPYYPSGEKLSYDISGGCIRLRDKNAEVIWEGTELNMPVLVIDKKLDNFQYSKENILDFPKISAKAFLVADLDSGFIFAQKNSQKQFPIASITKLMTAVIVAENIDLRKSILVTKDMLSAYGSTKGLEAGKRFRVVELFYPLLIESSNDAAEVLSRFLGREKTIKLMNEKAQSILMKNTHFTDPSGFDLGNISTAQDLFYLARYILNNRPPLFEIGKGKKVLSFGKVQFQIEKFWNKNIFINDPTFVGGKTGFLPKAGQTALFVFQLEDKKGNLRNIVISLLKSENIKRDTQKVYIWLQKNYFK